jgi:hypothetical protein
MTRSGDDGLENPPLWPAIQRCTSCHTLQAPPYMALHDWTEAELTQSLTDALNEVLGSWPAHGRTHWGDPCECSYCDYRCLIMEAIAQDQEPCSCPGECRGCNGGVLARDCPCKPTNQPLTPAQQRSIAEKWRELKRPYVDPPDAPYEDDKPGDLEQGK